MKMTRPDRSLFAVAGVSLTLLASLSIVSAQNVLNISQPDANTGILVDSWAWQSFTVTQESTLTTFAFNWNGCAGDLGATATVDLLTGEGTGGTLLASATGSVNLDNAGTYEGYNFFTADFGCIDLSAGQYTVSIRNATDPLQLVGTTYDSYAGGKLVSDAYGDSGMDASFSTPSPITSSPVPEPSSIALAGLGLVGLLASRRKSNK
jgi:hypothetical protein